MTDLTIGADPEFFVWNRSSQSFVSAHDLLPGTKEKPMQLKEGAVQVDGLAAEINIRPARKAESFYQHIQSTRKRVRRMLKNKGSFDIVAEPTVIFKEDYFNDLPDDIKVIGCDIDWDAYSMSQAPIPKLPGSTRFAGGHIHIGWLDLKEFPTGTPDDVFIDDCVKLTRQLDACLHVLSPLWDGDFMRRKYYGKGRFRPKPYGLEYRALSNAWTEHTHLVKWIFNASSHAFKLIEEGSYIGSLERNKMFSWVYDEFTDFKRVMSYYEMLVNLYEFPQLPVRFLQEDHYNTIRVE